MANSKQIQQVIPLMTCEISLGQNVCELVFGVDVFDLDFGIQINSTKQPIKSNSVGSGLVSHRWTSSFDHHFDDSFNVFENVQRECVLVGT